MSSTRNTAVILKQLVGAPSKVKLMISNQFPGIELVSPVYNSDGACYLSPDRRVDIGSTMQADFGIDITQSESVGILAYKLRKNTDQPDETTYIHLVVIWEVNSSSGFYVYSDLIESDKSYVWDRDDLMSLASEFELVNMQHAPIEETYLMHDNTVLMTRVNVTHEEECYKLEMTISETSIKDDTMRIQYIDMWQ
jgi:hypothetical protein